MQARKSSPAAKDWGALAAGHNWRVWGRGKTGQYSELQRVPAGVNWDFPKDSEGASLTH